MKFLKMWNIFFIVSIIINDYLWYTIIFSHDYLFLSAASLFNLAILSIGVSGFSSTTSTGSAGTSLTVSLMIVLVGGATCCEGILMIISGPLTFTFCCCELLFSTGATISVGASDSSSIPKI